MDREIASSDLRQLFSYWSSRLGAGFPKRADFGPAKMRPVLGGVSFIEIQRNPLRFFFRSYGTELVGWFGFDVTGKFLDQCPHAKWSEQMTAHLADVARWRVPSVSWYFDEIIDHVAWNLESLVLPISSDGARLDMLINAIARHRKWRAVGRRLEA